MKNKFNFSSVEPSITRSLYSASVERLWWLLYQSSLLAHILQLLMAQLHYKTPLSNAWYSLNGNNLQRAFIERRDNVHVAFYRRLFFDPESSYLSYKYHVYYYL